VNIQPQTVGLLKHAYQYGLDKRSRSVTRQKRNGRLLDVGCASGVFLNHFRQQPGWNVFGVEINPEAAAYARNQYHLNVTTGTVEQASFPEGHFDAVTLWDVLEHFHDPVASLREIRRILKPDGILVFRVPNGASWDAKIFGRYWVGLEAPRHLYIYDPPTINSLLRKTGFNRLSLTTQGAGYTTFVLSLGYWRSSHSHHEKKKQPSDQIMTILKHPIARLLSAPVFYLPGVFQRGPMMTVTAAKSSREGLA
jgi:SAM-dependent methyltransferase